MENAPTTAPVERLVRLPFVEVGHIPGLPYPHQWNGFEDEWKVASVSYDGRTIVMKRGDDTIDLQREGKHHFVASTFDFGEAETWQAIKAASRQVEWPYIDARLKSNWIHESECGCKVEYSGINEHYLPTYYPCRKHDDRRGGLRMCDVRERIIESAKQAHRSEFGFA